MNLKVRIRNYSHFRLILPYASLSSKAAPPLWPRRWAIPSELQCPSLPFRLEKINFIFTLKSYLFLTDWKIRYLLSKREQYILNFWKSWLWEEKYLIKFLRWVSWATSSRKGCLRWLGACNRSFNSPWTSMPLFRYEIHGEKSVTCTHSVENVSGYMK